MAFWQAVVHSSAAVPLLEPPFEPQAASASMANAPSQVPTFVLFIVHAS